jgi:hypothetical protein
MFDSTLEGLVSGTFHVALYAGIIRYLTYVHDRYFTGGKPASECGVIARRVANMLADASEAKRAKAEAAADGGARGGKTMAGARSLMMKLAEAEGAAEGEGVVGGSKKRKADGSPGYGG